MMIRNLILLWLKIYFASASQKQLNSGSCNLQSKRYDKWLNKLQDDQSLIESKFSVEKNDLFSYFTSLLQGVQTLSVKSKLSIFPTKI